MIELDGSFGEGGGQILRTALVLSAITRKPFHIINIRANRSNPGLRAQHLTAIRACAEICNAQVSNTRIHSKEITFIPGPISSGKYKFDIGTAGSIPLLLETILPVLVFGYGTSRIELFGGTDVPFSPSMDYVSHVLCDFLQRLGINTHIHILRYGFYPKGQGHVKVLIYPWIKRYSLHLQKNGKLKIIDTISRASSNLKTKDTARRLLYGFKEVINKKIGDEEISYENTACSGFSFHAHAHYQYTKLGTCEIGTKNFSPEHIGRKAAHKLLEEMKSSATLDRYMADQLLIFLAITGGSFKISKQTSHFNTNKYIIQKFLNTKIINKNNTIYVYPDKDYLL